ncbi:hypothetical protein [Paenibacillus sp. UNC451MF]|uniref:hypothetical protein n=1 Tax=Paenibacillus sp. UNC451MF TaxID=1449063 RepID=UPI00048B895E|nr:hypothetical protein [Paenibacillus sp. UNC451MF]
MKAQSIKSSTANSESAQSSIQLETPMKSFKKLYLILILLGAIALAFGGPVGILFGIVIGWVAAYLTLQGISGFKLMKLNFKDYPLPHPVTDVQLYEHLSSISFHPDFKLEQGVWGIRFIFKNMTAHKIHIDQKKQTYSIISKLTKKNLVKKRHNPGVTEYSFAFTAVPIIKQLVDEAAASLSEPDSSSAKGSN